MLLRLSLFFMLQLLWGDALLAYPVSYCQKLALEIEEKLKDTNKNFIELTNWHVFLHILQYRFPKDFSCFQGDRLKPQISKSLLAIAAKKHFARESLLTQQAILDAYYFADKKSPKEVLLPEHDVFAYIFFRALKKSYPLMLPDRNFDALLKTKSQQDLGYYLTHVVLYDSNFFKRPLDRAHYRSLARGLLSLIPWVVATNNIDLASEIFLCLSFLGDRTSIAFAELKRFIENYRVPSPNEDNHERVVLLLAKIEASYQKPKAIHLLTEDGKTQSYLFGNLENKNLVIAINGGPGWSHRSILPLADLSRYVPVLLYDQFGVGESEKSSTITATFDLAMALRQLRALVDQFPHHKIILLGHSFGSLFAFEFARRYPQRVNQLILLSPFLVAKKWQQVADSLVARLDVEHKIKRRFFAKCYTPEDLATLNHAFNDKHVLTDYQRYARFLGDANHDIYERLFGKTEFMVTGSMRDYHPSLKQPLVQRTLLMTGEFDTADEASLNLYRSYFFDAKLVVVPQGQHAFYFDHLGTTVKHLHHFLSEH